MLKFSSFVAGIGSGLFLGVYFREKGVTNKLTKAFYAFKNDEYTGTNTPKPKLHKPNMEDLHDHINKGLIDPDQMEKVKEMIETKRFDDVDKVIMQDPNKKLNNPEYRVAKAEKNAFFRDK